MRVAMRIGFRLVCIHDCYYLYNYTYIFAPTYHFHSLPHTYYTGMRERIQLLALPDYIPPPFPGSQLSSKYMLEPYTGTKYNPMYVIISDTAVPKRGGTLENVIALACAIGAFGLSFLYSTDLYAMNKVFVDQVMAGNADTLDQVFTLTLGIIGLQVAHDVGHVIMANIYKLPISIPYYLPSLQIGTFGTITNLLGYPKDRKQLFDVSIAGPFVGFLSSLALMVTGLVLTQGASPSELLTYPSIPTGFFTSSFLLFQLTDFFLHISQTLPTLAPTAAAAASSLNQLNPGESLNAITSGIASAAAGVTAVHPFVGAGMIGLLTNAFNFMPIGRLDGGRVFMSIFGKHIYSLYMYIVFIT